MGLLSPRAPGRLDHLRRIRALDPEVDHDEILRLTARTDDTILIGDEATLDGIDSPRSHAALRRLNRIHGYYDIPDQELAHVLATTIVGPVRWIEASIRIAKEAAPPRRTAYVHRPLSCPGGHTLADLGPLSMLDDLNGTPHHA